MDLFSRSPDIHNGVSGHVETVILMSNRNIKPDGYIKLEVNTEELDAAKSGISDTSSEDF